MNTEKTYQCGCGAWTGERCKWTGPASEMVVVEWMPEYLRASHSAAGSAGLYPHNGSERVAVEKSCADLLMQSESDREWAQIVSASPAKYAEEVE